MITRQQLKRYGKAALALAMVAGSVASFATPASANHEANTIRVGVSNTGGLDQNFFDDSDMAKLSGTPITFSWDFGTHNVRWNTTNPAVLAPSPGGSTDALAPAHSVTPTVAGTYLYWCSLHGPAATTSTTNFTTPTSMYGRLVISADSLAPTWDATAATATANSASQITVAWNAAADNSGSVFYDVFQNTVNTKPATPVSDNQTGLTYVHSGLTAGSTYYYWIVAVDGANLNGPTKTATATTTSQAASAAATAVVAFAVSPTMSISVTPALLDLGTLSPAAAGIGTATVTVGSNDTWSLNVKSIGRDGVDGAPGDDASFTDNGVKTIPVSRATWNAGAGATPLSDVSAVARTAQPAAAATAVSFAFSLQPLFTDPVGINFRTTVLYTATQP